MSDKLRSHEFRLQEPDYLTMNKDEIDKGLDDLLNSEVYLSRMADSMASCYVRAPDVWREYFVKCDGCGGQCSMFVNHCDEDETPDIIPKYQALTKRFRKLGYEAELRCYCEKCVSEFPEKLAPLVFSFRAEGMKEPVLSYPEDTKYEAYQYEQALRFLEGLKEANTFDAITNESMYEHETKKRKAFTANIRSVIGPAPQHNKPGYDGRAGLRERAKHDGFPF